MKELIYKESALKVLDDYKTDMVEGIPNAYSMARKRMEGLMPRRGDWVENGCAYGSEMCNQCGFVQPKARVKHFCPNCGCAMTKEGE